MKSIVQTSVAVFIMLTLAVVYAAAQQPPVTGTQTVSGYVLGPDDQIVIRLIDAPDISDKPVLIGTNGDITLPMIGRVKAGGLTVEQLETELNTRLKEFIQEPQTSVTVTEFGSQPVSIFGAVKKPGVVQLRGQQTLYQVLSMAGGPREDAGLHPHGNAPSTERRHSAARCEIRSYRTVRRRRIERGGYSRGKERVGEHRDQTE